MKNLSLIAAIGKNRELGKNNDLIWKIKEDMQHFRNKTMNHPIVMGYRTYKSLPKLLPGRLHVVISRTKIDNPDVITYNNLVFNDDRLIVPHKYIHERNFVLAPLVEMYGDIDVDGKSIKQSLNKITEKISLYKEKL